MKKSAILLLLIASAGLTSCEKKAAKPTEYIADVKARCAKAKKIPLVFEGIGHFVAYNSAEIKAQVEGILMELHFQEGQFVNEGDPLFTIDPRPYQAQLDKVIAEKIQALAQLQYAAEKVARYQTLLPENYVSILDYIQFQTDMANLEGVVMQKDAEITLAEINLDYCFIKAPFSGITSKKLIDKGNLIVNDGKSLLVIKQIDPIFIDFSLPERDFLKISRYFKGKSLEVEIEFPDHPGTKFTAELLLFDNEINQRTGMIPLRAQMNNKESLFWPGQFVRSNLIVSYIDNATMVPESTVQIGQKGQYAYVINKNREAEERLVTTGEQVDGEIQILSGINPGELCITAGQLSVRHGTKVRVTNLETLGDDL